MLKKKKYENIKKITPRLENDIFNVKVLKTILCSVYNIFKPWNNLLSMVIKRKKCTCLLIVKEKLKYFKNYIASRNC